MTVSAYQAPPPMSAPAPTPGMADAPYSALAMRGGQSSAPTGAYTHSMRHVGVSSSHSVHAQMQDAASSTRMGDAPSFPKVAFTPQQSLHLHNTTHTPSGAYSARVASFAEAAAAAEEKSGHPLAGRSVRLAGRVEPPALPRAFIEPPPKKRSSRAPKVQPPPPVEDDDSDDLLSELLDDDPPAQVPRQPSMAQQSIPPPPVAEVSSGPLFPGGMPALSGASALATYRLKPVAAAQNPPAMIAGTATPPKEPQSAGRQPPAVSKSQTAAPAPAPAPAPAQAQAVPVPVVPVYKMKPQKLPASSAAKPNGQQAAPPSATVATRHDNVELGDPNVAEAEIDSTIDIGTSKAAQPATPARPKVKEVTDELTDEIDSLLLGDDDAIAAAINAVNASFDEPSNLAPAHQAAVQEAKPVEATDPDSVTEEEQTEDSADTKDSQKPDETDALIDSLLDD